MRKVPFQEEFDASGSAGPIDGPPLLMVVVGDSSCTGPGVGDRSEIWCSLIAARIADRGYRVTLKSFALGGATSSTALQTQVPEAEALNARLVRRAIDMDGTCTGEHGIGLGKQDWLVEELGDAVEMMRILKRAVDPDDLFNPGKIFTL